MYVARDVADSCLPIKSFLPIASARGTRGKLRRMEEGEGGVRGGACCGSEGGELRGKLLEELEEKVL